MEPWVQVFGSVCQCVSDVFFSFSVFLFPVLDAAHIFHQPVLNRGGAVLLAGGMWGIRPLLEGPSPPSLPIIHY